ncbi:MAG: hypothetical protein COB67_05035 [SAR324 cluster bacterium]|uniref:Cyclic nucleotide-binding domain-containing protein n=1 Tax=SAR324 cluster bacterium TaxID=2024889 RepID=A0A2A4T696_9DELT|nr:MAG: hypothetical protein COB67_05035 [SAR324 cluster bacterium]
MSDPKANYLKFIAPDVEYAFVELLKEVPLFSKTPVFLLQKIFQYSKFLPLQNQERLINEGMYDQEIFILLKGKLEVYIKTATGEDQVDIIDRPFSLFGERCILGEPRGASIQANGAALLLGIDLSFLPDLIDALECPENKLNDSEYRANRDMYSLFATVLLDRLDKLIKDQYKLNQKLIRIHASQNLKVSWWKQEVLLTRIFNEFCDNQLSLELNTKEILTDVLRTFQLHSKRLEALLEASSTDTSQVYFELVRLHSLGKLEDLSKVIYSIVRHLTTDAHNSRRYMEYLQTDPIEFPPLVPLSYYLDILYQDICDSKILIKELSKELFLNAILADNRPNPTILANFLEDGGWVKDEFTLAHIMYLACKHCIYQVAEVNKAIKQYISYINAYSTPKQLESEFLAHHQQLQRNFDELYCNCTISGRNQASEHSKNTESDDENSSSPDHDIDDLLSQFGM